MDADEFEQWGSKLVWEEADAQILCRLIDELAVSAKDVRLLDLGVGSDGTSLLVGLSRGVRAVVGVDVGRPECVWETLPGSCFMPKRRGFAEFVDGDILKWRGPRRQLKGCIDIYVLNKTLHHLRDSKCKYAPGPYGFGTEPCGIDERIVCVPQSCGRAIGELLGQKLLRKLVGKKRVVLVSEHFAMAEDKDREDATSGYLDAAEWRDLFLSFGGSAIRFFEPFQKTFPTGVSEDDYHRLVGQRLGFSSDVVFAITGNSDIFRDGTR